MEEGKHQQEEDVEESASKRPRSDECTKESAVCCIVADITTKSSKGAENAPGGRLRARKLIVLFGYSGTGYQGMQRNPGLKTIEEDLLNALCKGGFIRPEGVTSPSKLDFQRTARTDKGVHATRQVLSHLYCWLTSIGGLAEDD